MSCDVEDTCVCAQPCREQRMCRTCPYCTPMDPDFDETYEDEVADAIDDALDAEIGAQVDEAIARGDIER
jgi:hypothetical protein